MPVVPIEVPDLLGGVSRKAQVERSPNQVQAMDNADPDPVRGTSKRSGSEFIESQDVDSTQGELPVHDPDQDKKVFWINRGEGEQFVVLVDPDVADNDFLVEAFDITDGTRVVVEANGQPIGDDLPISNAAIRAYLSNGAQDVRRRLRALTVEDATFILNRTVLTALDGAAATFNDAGGSPIRNISNAHNQPTWADFDQPPTTVAPYPDRATRLAYGSVNSDAIWYARDNDVGQPQGFYWAISSTQPPWYQRLRTEPVNSMIDIDTFPVQMAFDGSQFDITQPEWTDRFSGDSTTNPGPSFIGGAVSDLVFHQDRLVFLSGERVVSSRAGDIFNLWIDSIILRNDRDPVDQGVPGGQENRTHVIDWGVSFHDALVLLTRGSRQVELRANGPLGPNTAFLSPTTALRSVEYLPPTTMGGAAYFAGERDFSMVLYEYAFDQQAFSNVATDVTRGQHGYIPAEASLIVASEAHQQLFLLTDAEPSSIYVYRTEDAQLAASERRLRTQAWHRWTFDDGGEILSIQTVDDHLYLLIRRDGLIWIERIPLGLPEQDTDTANGTLQGMGYSIPIDRKTRTTGVYNATADITTFTLPYEDDTIDELVLGPSWDADDGDDQQRLAGQRFHAGENMDVVIVNNTTILQVDGQFATNILGNTPDSFAGRSYNMDIHLSQQFYRDPNTGRPVHGNLQLMTCFIRHKDTGFYALEVTPENRATLVKEFVVPDVGSTPLDSPVLEEFGEFQPRVLSRADTVSMHLTNDSPVPCSIVSINFMAEFVPLARSPVK